MKNLPICLMAIAVFLAGFLAGRIPPTVQLYNLRSVMGQMKDPEVFVIDREPPTTGMGGHSIVYNSNVRGLWILDPARREKRITAMRELCE
jgi:hypothetical protein